MSIKVTNIYKPERMIYRIDGRKVAGKKKIPGRILNTFIFNIDSYHFAEIEVYKDGKIDCHSDRLVDIKGLKKKIKEGWLTTSLPDGANLSIVPFGNYKIKKPRNFVKEDEFIKEILDVIENLNGRPSSEHKCVALYEEYLKKPNGQLRKKLKKAYYNVPEHRREYLLGDMDRKDWPIRKIIEGYKDDVNAKFYTPDKLIDEYKQNPDSKFFKNIKSSMDDFIKAKKSGEIDRIIKAERLLRKQSK